MGGRTLSPEECIHRSETLAQKDATGLALVKIEMLESSAMQHTVGVHGTTS